MESAAISRWIMSELNWVVGPPAGVRELVGAAWGQNTHGTGYRLVAGDRKCNRKQNCRLTGCPHAKE